LTTFEIDHQRATMAQEHFKEAGVEKMVTIIEGDAHELVTKLKGPIDVAFIDADKSGYVDYLNKLSGYEVRALTDDKQFAVLSSSRPFGSGSPKVRTTSARTGAMYSCSGRKKISSATPADFSPAIADRTTSWLMSRVRCSTRLPI
jgi:spermidine synthase